MAVASLRQGISTAMVAWLERSPDPPGSAVDIELIERPRCGSMSCVCRAGIVMLLCLKEGLVASLAWQHLAACHDRLRERRSTCLTAWRQFPLLHRKLSASFRSASL